MNLIDGIYFKILLLVEVCQKFLLKSNINMENKFWVVWNCYILIFFVKFLNKRFDVVILLENKVFIKKLYIEYFYKFLWKYNVLLLQYKVKKCQNKRCCDGWSLGGWK